MDGSDSFTRNAEMQTVQTCESGSESPLKCISFMAQLLKQQSYSKRQSKSITPISYSRMIITTFQSVNHLMALPIDYVHFNQLTMTPKPKTPYLTYV